MAAFKLKEDEIRKIEEIIKPFIEHDIEQGIRAKANFMVALALSAYTEFLGKILIGPNSKCCERYNEFLKKMGPYYENLLEQEKDLYDRIRCGLVHEYFIKESAKVSNNPENPNDRTWDHGIGVDPITKKIYFYNNAYFEDFKIAMNNLFSDILNGKEDQVKNFREVMNENKLQ